MESVSDYNRRMSNFFNNSIFWIDVDKIKPNPYQPRREFDDARLKDLAESIRMYGVLQPLVVTRSEVIKEDGGIAVEYELISGERRMRASKLAGLREVPALIHANADDSKTKLEIAIIENLQREDLNVVERARAFRRLADEFNFKHAEIGKKVGKSREYVSNTLRVLMLPEEILNALSEGKISEGHTRPLLMLTDRPEEQMVLLKEIIYKKITVREAEQIGRKIAFERARKKDYMPDPELVKLEEDLAGSLGTRVHIERRDTGGKLVIDFFTNDDLRTILDLLKANQTKLPQEMMERFIAAQKLAESTPVQASTPESAMENPVVADAVNELENNPELLDDRSGEEKKEDEESEDLYSIKNFSL
jgi:ParB family transcriptional regulator, chromosome partitioning protein